VGAFVERSLILLAVSLISTVALVLILVLTSVKHRDASQPSA
jgi:hypothetical protein